jgi:hypothetical protein
VPITVSVIIASRLLKIYGIRGLIKKKPRRVWYISLLEEIIKKHERNHSTKGEKDVIL